MPISFAALLAVVQALTEFLPVSSSGHLAIIQTYLEPILGLSRTPLAFDVLIHLATMFAAVYFLRNDIAAVISGVFKKNENSKRAWKLVLLVGLGILPAGIIGLLAKDTIEETFRSIVWPASGFLLTALILEIAHRKQAKQNSFSLDDQSKWQLPTVAQALLIGLAQAVAILPGVSRSGSTIGVALMLGLPSISAIRFSFLTAIPIISGAMLLEFKALLLVDSSNYLSYSVAFLIAMLVGYAALLLLVKLTQGLKLRYFAIYTLVLGITLHLFHYFVP
jgi:undecaprenyl-diphosphatase